MARAKEVKTEEPIVAVVAHVTTNNVDEGTTVNRLVSDKLPSLDD